MPIVRTRNQLDALESGNRGSRSRRAQIPGMLVEGVSVRAISRMTGASKNTIVKLLTDAGNACLDYQDRMLRNLSCQRIQADEIWSFVYAKQRETKREERCRQWKTEFLPENILDGGRHGEARGEIVLDSFLGSGTTVIAAERTGRRCHGLELDSTYVDTIVRRWQSYTGERARHAVTGRFFDELETEAQELHGR
jgi:uncharacterized protein YerC